MSTRIITLFATALLALTQGAGADFTDVNTESDLRSLISNGIDVRLKTDIHLSSYLQIHKKVTIDLNSYKLYRTVPRETEIGAQPVDPEGNGHVIEVFSDGELTIEDGSVKKTGMITGGYAKNGGGIINYGKLIINGGTIDDNWAADGGGIKNGNEDFTSPILTITGGVISNNYSYAGGGGIVNYGTANISGATFLYNKGTTRGGAIWTKNSLTVENTTFRGNYVLTRDGDGAELSQAGGGAIFMNAGTATLTNVQIINNYALDGGAIWVLSGATLNVGGENTILNSNYSFKHGGGAITNYGTVSITNGNFTDNCSKSNGAAVWNKGTLSINGGSFTGNRAGIAACDDPDSDAYPNNNGAVFQYSGSGSLSISGNPVISGNYGYNNSKVKYASDVYLDGSKKLNINGTMTDGAHIGLLCPNCAAGPFTSGYETNNSGVNPNKFFIDDQDSVNNRFFVVNGELNRFAVTTTGAITYATGSNPKWAIIDGAYQGNATATIASNTSVDTIVFERPFEVGKFSTIVLPFSIAVNKVDGANFYTLTDFEKVNNTWKKAEAQKVSVEGNLAANTPYLLEPTATKLVFHGGATLKTSENPPYANVEGTPWVFYGTYGRVEFADSITLEQHRYYGFAAQERDGYTVGQFARAGKNAYIPPMRAYLRYGGSDNLTKNAGGLGLSDFGTLPETIDVKIMDEQGNVTETATLDTRTGVIKRDRWFDLQGRQLKGKPSIKGKYLHNGKVEVVK